MRIVLAVVAAGAAAAAAATLALTRGGGPTQPPPAVSADEIVLDTFDGSFVRLSDATRGLVASLRDAIRPVYEPVHGAPPTWLQPDDVVIGVGIAGDFRAYPLAVLERREIVNDVVGGEAVAVTYCPLCGSAAVYSRQSPAGVLRFGNTSGLYESDLVMFDHQTESLWVQTAGKAIRGALAGTELAALPVLLTTWRAWRQAHPETKVLVGDGTTRFPRVAPSPTSGYEAQVDLRRFAFPVTPAKLDGRLRLSDVTLVAEAAGMRKAYPLRLLRRVVGDTIGGVRVVVIRGRDGRFASAFRARAGAEHLTFEDRGGTTVDRETGSEWDDFGRARRGPLAGAQLEALPQRRVYWFSVTTTFGAIDVYGVSGRPKPVAAPRPRPRRVPVDPTQGY